VSWALLGLTFVILQLGAILDLPQIVRDLSPFTHVPAVPAASVSALPLVALTVVAALLCAGGLAAFQRRDLAL
jgi:ABC-2 type transport system permease protein